METAAGASKQQRVSQSFSHRNQETDSGCLTGRQPGRSKELWEGGSRGRERERGMRDKEERGEEKREEEKEKSKGQEDGGGDGGGEGR